jgi:outer membrane protein assembly factor BamD (BamD/ComL family)
MIIFTAKKTIPSLLWGAFLVFGLSACLTDSQTIPAGMPPEELVQRAQEASDKSRYSLALRYYQVLYDENRDSSDWALAAEYEIAFIHYKQKKYPEAREELNTLLRRYDTPDEALLPQQFKYLAAIVLQSIDDKEAKQRAPRRQSPATAQP